MAIKTIKLGDKIKCLKCHEVILVSEETFKLTPANEYIECLQCGFKADVQMYHIMGEKL